MLVVLSWWEQTASKKWAKKIYKKGIQSGCTQYYWSKEFGDTVGEVHLVILESTKTLQLQLTFKSFKQAIRHLFKKTLFAWFKIIPRYLLLGGTTHVCYSQPRWCFENSFATYNDIWGNTSRKFIRAWLNNKRAMAWKDWYFFRICTIINS